MMNSGISGDTLSTATLFWCSPALQTSESMVARLAPIRRGAFTASFSASFVKHVSSLWFSDSASTSSRSGLTEERQFSQRLALSNVRGLDTRRAYHRQADGGTPNGIAAEVYQQQQDLPRPPRILWEKDLVNSVHLIGNVGRDIELKYLESGKVLATTSFAVNRRPRSDEPSWFLLEIWDELAEIAAYHVKKGQLIFVSGRVEVDRRQGNEGTSTVVKVIVDDLCFVESSGQSQGEVARVDSSQQSDKPAQGMARQKAPSSTSTDASALEKRWQEYFSDPSQWWDNRENKRNPKSPDFKHKSTQEALWITSWSNPPWVQKQLEVLEQKKRQHNAQFGNSSGSQGKRLSSFQDSDLNW